MEVEEQEKIAGTGHLFLSPAEKPGSLNLPKTTGTGNFSTEIVKPETQVDSSALS